MSTSSNDNTPIPTSSGDENGQAAILLVESLIHGLIEKSVLSVTDAIEIIDAAANVSRDLAVDAPNGPVNVRTSSTLLDAMSRSLSRDLPRR